jgi:hypothetical protein
MEMVSAERPHAVSMVYAVARRSEAMACCVHYSIASRETSGKPAKRRKKMKNINWKWNALALAAAMAVTSAVASAQDTRMKATVPFDFSINGKAHLAAGNYIVTRDGTAWLVRSEDSSKGVYFVAIGRTGQTAEKPALRFECLGQHCQLRAVHAGGTELGAELPAHRLTRSEAAEVAVVNIPLEMNRGN